MVSVFVPVLLLLVVLLVLGGAAVVVGRAWAGAVPSLSPRTLLAGYLYVVVLASTVIVAAGVGQLLTAGFAQAFGLEFSYQTYRPQIPPPARMTRLGPGEPTAEQLAEEQRFQEEQRLDQIRNEHRDALAQGVTAFLVGGLVALPHLLAKRRIRAGGEPSIVFLDRAEGIVGLLLFTAVGLYFAVAAVYQLVRYALFPQVGAFGQTIAPGWSLGLALTFVPLWLLRLRRFVDSAT
jgi:hypothetical protein